MSEPILTVQELAKSYGDIQAVRGVSFQVGRGEIFGLLGPNGAGKTTTVSMLT
ncbi:MAG: ATP-binding cassette domain-containing protein, partial [Chloroflexia bacterium]